MKVVGAAGDGDETTFFEEVFRLDELYVIETSNRSLYPPNFICFQFNGVRCTSLRLAQIFGRLAGAAGAPTPFALDLDDDTRPSRETAPLPPKPLVAIQERLDKLHAFAAVEERLADALDERLAAATLVRRDTLQAALAVETERVRRRGEENVSGARTIPGSRLETLMQATETMARSIRRLQALSQEKQRQHVQLKVSAPHAPILRRSNDAPPRRSSSWRRGSRSSSRTSSWCTRSRRARAASTASAASSCPTTSGASPTPPAAHPSPRVPRSPSVLSLVGCSAVKDDETLSSGVGYLVHVLLMLSKYWEVRPPRPPAPASPPRLTTLCLRVDPAPVPAALPRLAVPRARPRRDERDSAAVPLVQRQGALRPRRVLAARRPRTAAADARRHLRPQSLAARQPRAARPVRRVSVAGVLRRRRRRRPSAFQRRCPATGPVYSV